ncbi:MAG: hypothetical protein STHCBS139747_002163 [Sporothrix thermara]
MPDNFDFNTEPAPDETINMDHRSSDGEDSEAVDELPFEAFEEEEEEEDGDGGDEESDEENDGYGSDKSDDAASLLKKQARGGRAFLDDEAEEDDEDDEDDEDGRGESLGEDSDEGEDGDGWETTSSDRERAHRRRERRHRKSRPYVDSLDYDDEYESYDDEDDDMGIDYDDGAYDSADSWDIDVCETPNGTFGITPDMDKVKARLRFFDAIEHIDLPTSFPQFQKLPPELRMRIWETFCSQLRRKNRVIQVMLQSDGRLTPAVTLDQQTEPVRRFMSICRETRAMGLQALPDTLPIGVSEHDDGVVRFNAKTDVVHFLEEHPLGLERIGPAVAKGEVGKGDDDNDDEGGESESEGDGSNDEHGDPDFRRLLRTMRRRRARARKLRNENYPKPYTSVRNLAINDLERRLRPPGAYQDYYNGHTVIELIAQDDASHRQPSELRDAKYLHTLEYLFPNVENVYVVEYGAIRKADRWTGHLRSYQRYHAIGYEVDDIDLRREPVECLYCWHEPPKGSIRGRVGDKEGQHQQQQQQQQQGTDAAESVEEKLHREELESLRPADFKDEVVINHFAKLRERGVRFSRMLFFDEETGMTDYWGLQARCRPDGHWPNDPDGRPQQDQQPTRDLEPPMDIGAFDEYEDNSMIDDEEQEEDDWEDDEDDEDDEDGDDIDDNGDVVDPVEAMFSSPEPGPSTSSRNKRRRVVDSDDEDEDEDEDESKDGKEARRSRSPAKRRRRTAVISSDEEDDDDNEKEKGDKKRNVAAVKTKAASKSKITEDDGDSSSSHTEPGEDEDEDEDDDEDEEDDKPAKPLTLMQRLQAGRKENPISDEENSSDDDDEEEEEEYAGDYGDINNDDDDDDDDE